MDKSDSRGGADAYGRRDISDDITWPSPNYKPADQDDGKFIVPKNNNRKGRTR